MGPVAGTMVRTTPVCEVESCTGWAVDGGIEVRCLDPVHRERLVDAAFAAKAAGITHRRLDHWCSQRLVRVAGAPNPGSGHHRMVTEHEAATLHLMARLVNAGVAPLNAATLARDLWDEGEAELGDHLTVVYQPKERLA